MKPKCFTILILLSFLCNRIAAQEYEISLDRKTITVKANCTIPVEKFAPSNIIIYGNGDKGGDGKMTVKGRGQVYVDRFKLKTEELNGKNAPGVSFKRENKIAYVIFDFSKLKSDTELQFYAAKSSNIRDPRDTTKMMIDWSPDKNNIFKVSVKKWQDSSNAANAIEANNPEIPGKQTVANSYEIAEVKKKLEKLENEIVVLKKREDPSIDWTLPIYLFMVLLVSCLFFSMNRKRLKVLSKANSELGKAVNELKAKKNSQVVPQQVQQVKEKVGRLMTDDEIKRFVVEQIKAVRMQESVVDNQKPIEKKPVQTNTPVTEGNQYGDTDNVKYHQNDNSFSIEQTDIHIFRIYAKGGDYYYTIVDDPAIREELIGMLQMFEGCIAYQTTDRVAKRVEPVTDGKLRKEGNRFYVDNNNKMIVKFV